MEQKKIKFMKFINWSKENYLLILLLLLAIILRLYHLDYQSVWLDELHTLIETNPNTSLTDVKNSILISEVMPPLYYYSIYYVFKIFGYSTYIARFFSVIMALINIILIYKLGKELYSKKVGLISALFLAVNPFHLFYSQEARPYVMLLVFTLLSFLYLVKFLKNPVWKNALLFGFYSGLMILCHFFGLFVLVSQVFILFLFFILEKRERRISFFQKSLVSGLLAIIFFIPGIEAFLKANEKKEFWIQPINLDTIVQVFKDFCGNSDFILYFSICAIIYYIIILIKDKKKTDVETKKNTQLFSFIVLSIWIFLVLAIPIIRSYLVIPMIQSRYFIVLIPAFIIVVAISIEKINNRKIAISIIAIVSLVSLYEIVIKNNYYTAINKSQFRETTQFVLKNKNDNDPIYSTISWHMSYFFTNQKLIEQPLQKHIIEMQKDTTNIKSFWHIDAHNNPYKLNEKEQKFIDANFIIEKKCDYFDSWCKHFIIKNSQNSKQYKVSESSIVLSNLSDENWIGGVGKIYNMMLLDYSLKNEKALKNAFKLRFKDGSEIKIIGVEKAGTFIQIKVEGNAKGFVEVASYPNFIELINHD
jgi:mannosyltransferase